MEKPINLPENSKYLKGVGSSAWFHIEIGGNSDEFIISRFTTTGNLECRNTFLLQITGFDIHKEYEFTYVSHCIKCSILQNGSIFTFIKM